MTSLSDQSFAELLGLLIVFQDSSIYDDGKCDTDNDVAGIGVVSAFVATASLTVILSVCAAMLDGASSAGGVLPVRVNTWLQRHAPQKIRSQKDSYRKVLDQTMIALADQQLLTGIAIIVSGYVRAANTILFNTDQWPYVLRLSENHFHLIIYLSCLSSSAHLASVVTLKSYFRAQSVPARVRLALVVVFALLLAASFMISWPFGFYAVAVVIENEGLAFDGAEWKLGAGYLALFWSLNGLAALLLLYPFWIAVINISEDLKQLVKSKISGTWHSDRRWLPAYWLRAAYHHGPDAARGRRKHRLRRRLEKRAKRVFWFLLLGSTRTAFFHQIFFFFVSLAYVLAQKTANVPREFRDVLCDLTTTGAGRWGFGQFLPMFLLCQPLLSGVAAYYDVFKPVGDPEASAASHQLLEEQAHDSSPESQDDDVELQSMRSSEERRSGRGTG